MKMLDLSLLSSVSSFYKDPLKQKGYYLSANAETAICGRSIPEGTYRLDRPINPKDPAWFEYLMSCKL
jgi:hypothetical protein